MTAVVGMLLLIAFTASGLEEKGSPMAQLTPNILTMAADGQPCPAGIGDVAWIAGEWRAQALGGTAEEVWSGPQAGTMMGMFRLIKEDRLVFYEILTISEKDESLIVRLKHFNPDLTGWEEKDEVVSFPLVKLGENEAYFDGMTFRRVENELHVFVASHHEDGTAGELVFEYTGRPAR
jgi:hypothetical protein